MSADLVRLVADGALVLTDGAIETRLMFETDVALPEHIEVAGLVGDPALRAVYAGYLAIAREHGLPVVLGTPTFRGGARYARAAGRDVEELNAAAVAWHRELRAQAGEGPPVLIAGVLGPCGDAYRPDEALGPEEAARYHAAQAGALARAGADFLFAATFPEVGEAVGAARAMGATGLPHVVSFVLDHEGQVLDGTPLAQAIARIDAEADPAPAFFSISCVHPLVAARALASGGVRGRVLECKANASALTPAQLVALDHPEADDADVYAAEMWALYTDHGVRVLGGCCGTDERHMRALAERMRGAQAAGRSDAGSGAP